MDAVQDRAPEAGLSGDGPLVPLAPPARPPRRRILLAGAVTLVAGVAGLWLFKATSVKSATLVVTTTPEGPFNLHVSTTVDGEARIFDGAQPISLAPGDYFISVVPATKRYARKRLKVHLSGNQYLALPVVLAPAQPEPPRPPPFVSGVLTVRGDRAQVNGAEVWVDGVHTGAVPLLFHPLPSGEHIVVLKRGGQQSDPIEITVGDSVETEVEGGPIPGSARP